MDAGVVLDCATLGFAALSTNLRKSLWYTRADQPMSAGLLGVAGAAGTAGLTSALDSDFASGLASGFDSDLLSDLLSSVEEV